MIRLFHFPQTRSMRSLWLLHELGAEAEVILRPFDKTLREAGYLERHPVGRVPALELDGQMIWESGAIAQALCHRFAPTPLGRTPADGDWLDWLNWLHFAETLSQHTAALTQQHVVIYKDEMRSPTVMKLEAARIGKCYDAVEARLEQSGGFLLGAGFTAADIGVGQAVYMARHFAALDDHPALARWFARLEDRPAYQASLPKPGEPRLYARDFYPAWDSG